MPLISHSIDFDKLIGQLLGNLNRKPIRIAWLRALYKAFESIHTRFLIFTDAKWEEIKYNDQTFVLEQMLITRFGAGIYIENNLGNADGNVIGTDNDWEDSIGAGWDFFGGIGETYEVALFDFTVYVPGAIVFVQSEMEAWIKKYSSNSFNIVIV